MTLFCEVATAIRRCGWEIRNRRLVVCVVEFCFCSQMSTPSPPAWKMRPIPASPEDCIGDFQRYPGARLLLSCAFCSWGKAYNPERVIARLQELKAGGHATRLVDCAKRVGWNCPACARIRWRMQFAWPPNLDAAEVRRIAARYRN